MKNVFYVRIKHIKYGYRTCEHMTTGKCVRSLFMVHNETFNVWTHLISGIYYLYQLYLIITASGMYKEIKQRSNLWIQALACLACIFCMLSSSTYHLFNSLNKRLYYILLKVDLIGIGVNITGLALTLIYCGFHNYSNVRTFFVLSIGTLMILNLFL